jgi:signal transduction histidine kinase
VYRLDRFTLDVDLTRVVRDVISGMQEEIERSGSKVSVRTSGDTVGRWDPQRLRHVVTNLLSNALKFGSRKPIVVVIDSLDEDHVRLRIRDHGIGVAPHEQSRIFERFQRAVSDQHYGGFGLGLWIVRQVIEAHGGTVGVKSEPTVATTFTVELPRSGPVLATQPQGNGAASRAPGAGEAPSEVADA